MARPESPDEVLHAAIKFTHAKYVACTIEGGLAVVKGNQYRLETLSRFDGLRVNLHVISLFVNWCLRAKCTRRTTLST